MAPICHLEMMGESLCVPNSTQSSQADKPTPCAPVFPRLLQNLEKFRTPPTYPPSSPNRVTMVDCAARRLEWSRGIDFSKW